MMAFLRRASQHLFSAPDPRDVEAGSRLDRALSERGLALQPAIDGRQMTKAGRVIAARRALVNEALRERVSR
ncbi:MAG TPA: hypothetical protein VK558_14615 [Patescibacteria group bacterium]|nr:hypothetical protein [Patescibacteria group bacterium]